MKKTLFTLLIAIIPTIASAVDVHFYGDPSQLPAAFTWNITRYDYYATGPNAEQLPAGSLDIVVKWDPSYRNTNGSYGKLTIENFYKHSRTSVCNLIFDNINTHNFEWNGDVCTFSLNSYNYASNVSSTGTANATLHYAFINSAIYEFNSSTYWIKPSYVTSSQTYPKTNYKYGGGTALTFTLDISEKSINIENSAWGAFMCASASGGSPSYVLDYYTRSDFVCTDTDLVDIIRDKEEGDEVIVADDLLCVQFLPQFSYDNNGVQTPKGSVLVCKDLGKYENENVNTAGAFDYMRETGLCADYDQSNWVVLTSNDFNTNSSDYVGYKLKGGTVKGTFTDKLNPTIAISEMPTKGDAMSYTPNVYVVPSFCDEYAAEGSEYFFVQPKPQEYCQVMWANYDAHTDAFYTPAKNEETGTNVNNLNGGFMWDKTYLNSGSGSDGTVYNFYAMVNTLPAESESYNVWVHIIDSNNGNALIETDDNNIYIYAFKGEGADKEEYFGSWPGKRMTTKRQAYDSGGTISNWYYVSLGTHKPDAILLSRINDGDQTSNIGIDQHDIFINYYPYGGGDRYQILQGCYVTPPSSKETATPNVNGGVSSRYVVMPLLLDNESVVTGIDNVEALADAPASVTYYNTMGMAASKPFAGINIEVKRYADGTMTATKKIINGNR